MNFKKFIVRPFMAIANSVWSPIWSNIRWQKERKLVLPPNQEDMATTLPEIKALVKKLIDKFEWTKDGIDQLGDSICPPAYNYRRYLNGLLKDDCDGFHSLVYHCLSNSGIECYLLCALTGIDGHCILLFKLDNKWYVNDYGTVHNGFDTAKEAIEDYNKIYISAYCGGKGEVLYNGITIFDYKDNKFHPGCISKLK